MTISSENGFLNRNDFAVVYEIHYKFRLISEMKSHSHTTEELFRKPPSFLKRGWGSYCNRVEKNKKNMV